MTDKEIQTVDSLRKEGILSLKDAQGNPRFVEDTGTITNVIEGLTITYNKWSLSGTHLMFVLAGRMNGTFASNVGLNLVIYNLPDYIKNKIVPVYSYSDAIEIKAMILRKRDGTPTSLTTILRIVDNKPRIDIWQAFTLDNEDYDFRIQFDLLIDADYDK